MTIHKANGSGSRSGSQGRMQAGLMIVAGLGLALTGCGSGGNKMQMPARPPALVTTATAIARDVPIYLDEIGRTVALDSVSIVPQVGGKIVAVHVQDGTEVKKGQVLFEIDPRPYEAALASAQATLAQNEAELELAEVESRRVQNLMKKDAASEIEMAQKKSALGVARAKIDAAKAAIENAKLNLEYSRILAPLDGRAGARLVDPGNVVKAYDLPLLVIQRLDPIYAEFTITENDLKVVRECIADFDKAGSAGTDLHLEVQVDVADAAARLRPMLAESQPTSRPADNLPQPRTGKLTFLDNTVQGASGTVRLRATVANADHYFWPGQFVNVRLVLATKKNAVLVPAQAQQIGQIGPYVYVVQADGTAVLRPITPGQRQGDLLVVEKGVAAGEQVVVTGQMTVVPNAKVVVAKGGATSQPGAEAPNPASQPQR